MARIDISWPSFLARDDLPSIALPLQQILHEAAAAPEEEIASSCLSLEEEINKFHSKEEENPRALIVNISDAEGKTDKHLGVHAPTLVIARPNSSSKEEKDKITLNKRNKSLRDLMAARNKVSTSKKATKSQIPPTLLPPPPPLPTNLGLKAIPDLKKKKKGQFKSSKKWSCALKRGLSSKRWPKTLGTGGLLL